ncbi:hypothetical protein [uncultured Draconibacterium sp.]|uniref:hypothetical protein n=1 Tax=uncultured Draconibacterium sp. TaxID=1573823 RepID=UPI0029C6D558|nr:hypothetical protein [uncultured Draconibacterium sp.]
MKTKVWAVIVLAFFVAGAASATELPKMNVIQVEENTAMLAYSFSHEAPLQVSLTNFDGEIMYYKETEHQTAFKKMFDFSELGDGLYCVSINYGNQSINRVLKVEDKKITVSNASFCYEPYYKVKGKMVNLSFLNTRNKPVYVSIYQDGKYIDGSNLGRDVSIQTRLDFSHLKRGTYQVVLTDCVKDHRYTLKL